MKASIKHFLFWLVKFLPRKKRMEICYSRLCSSLKFVGVNVGVEGPVFNHDQRLLVPGSNVVFGGTNTFRIFGAVIIGDGAKIASGFSMKEQVPQIEQLNFSYVRRHSFRIEYIAGNHELKLKEKCTGEKLGKRLVFVVSTGRSGTNTIADILNQHDNVTAVHEPFYFLNSLSTEYAHGWVSKEYVREKLIHLFCHCSIFESEKVNVLSDLKFSNLIEILADILPDSRFIWLVRKPQGFVASAYPRGWFDQHEYERFDSVVYSFDCIADRTIFEPYRWEYSVYRLNGGEVMKDPEKWNQMGAFERCCWYWAFWNDNISEQLDAIETNRKIKVHLERLSEELISLTQFLGISTDGVKITHKNKASYDTYSEERWSDAQREVFLRHCQSVVDRLYDRL